MKHEGASAVANRQGGFIYWLLNGFRGKWGDECTTTKSRRNIITAYIIDLLLVAAMIYFFVRR